MTKLTASDIAQKFSKGRDCEFWLTQKQTSWLFSVYQNETRDYSRFIGGSENGYRWEANKSQKSQTSLFKFTNTKSETKMDEELQNHPVYKYLVANGYTWEEYCNNPEFQIKILMEMNPQ